MPVPTTLFHAVTQLDFGPVADIFIIALLFVERFPLDYPPCGPCQPCGSCVTVALPARAADTAVEIKGMKFNPAETSVKVGDTVTITNVDCPPHTCTADNKSFGTGKPTKGTSGTITLAAAGDFPFHCADHPSMKGVIRVA